MWGRIILLQDSTCGFVGLVLFSMNRGKYSTGKVVAIWDFDLLTVVQNYETSVLLPLPLLMPASK
jgi:hypothetical protein